MTRILTAALLCLTLAAPLQAGVSCDSAAALTDQAVGLRQAGKQSQEQATRALVDQYGKGDAMRDLVPQLVAWVWSLPADRLGPDVGKAMKAQLAAQPGLCK